MLSNTATTNNQQLTDTMTKDVDEIKKRKLKLVVKNPAKLFPSSNSPLRDALSTPTPLLAASLSSPPVAIDLSRRSASPSLEDGPTNDTNLYANLLLQLNHHPPVAAVPKLSTARRKNAASMPCFQCPVCKKRFQRHIAMNAHFQNEHIASCGKTGGKLCKLCSKAAPDIGSLRIHLNSAHGIDLDNPLACLVEAAAATAPIASTPQPPLQKSLPPSRSDDDDSSTSSETVPTSSSTTPDQRMSPSLLLLPGQSVKPEPGVDMTVTSLKRQNTSAKKRLAKTAKRAKREDSSKLDTARLRCQFCLIDFPNQTLYFLHRGFHGEAGGDPWRCNGCGERCADMYDFNTHLVSVAHK